MSTTSTKNWTINDSESLYGFKRWGSNHFSVDEQGMVCVHPLADHRSIRVHDVMEEARQMGLKPPLTIRFQDLLRYRVQQINEAFNQAIKEERYEGVYRGVFPIKVNQLREVVEEILDAGEEYNFGIEAGSKPELLIALALHNSPNSLVICNGYKDDEYIRLALMGRKLGKEIFLVAEQISEVDAILKIAKETGIEPLIGLRVKLAVAGEGKWATSSGEDAKFGLTSSEIVEASNRIKKAGYKDALKLVHFHIGSQVPNILTIKKAVVEAARFYCELYKMGFPMEYLDVGGGLGIDYDGSRTNFESSMNYSMEEYARDVVFNIKQICNSADIPEPNIVSESGRALVASHSMLVIEVFDRISKTQITPKKGRKRHPILKEMDYILKSGEKYSRLERFHDAQQKKDEAYSLFNLGYLDLQTRAEVETIFYQICEELNRTRNVNTYQPEELEGLPLLLSDQYVCNFSVFQSLMDHWACDQLFPVSPIHRLDECPSVNARLVDITCDSEGKISDFIDLEDDAQSYLPLHALNGKPYYLGVYLVGAYQDIMGDLHNLFGRVNEVHVFLEDDEEDGFYIEESIVGSKVSDVLDFIQYKAHDLSRLMKRQVDRATKADRVKPREGVRMLDYYEELIRGKTYLSPAYEKPPRKRVVRRKRSTPTDESEAEA